MAMPSPSTPLAKASSFTLASGTTVPFRQADSTVSFAVGAGAAAATGEGATTGFLGALSR